MLLRPATAADSLFVYALRNLPEVRSVSHSTAHIPWETHIAWYRAARADPRRILLIIEEGWHPVGLIRATVENGTAEVSIALSRAARGRGLGTQALRRFVPTLQASAVIATIKDGNEASHRSFRKAGFVAQGQVAGVTTYRWTP